MRIVVPDAASASGLAERLTAAFGAESVSLSSDGREVDVHVKREPDRAVLQVVDTVGRWLDQAAAGSAEMWHGERSYMLSK